MTKKTTEQLSNEMRQVQQAIKDLATTMEKDRIQQTKDRIQQAKERERERQKAAKERQKRERAWEKERQKAEKEFQKAKKERLEREKVWERERQEAKKERQKEARENKKRINRLEELFVGQWGKLMESLVKGDLVRLLQERGIEIDGMAQETEKNYQGQPYEYDIIATNGKELVAVEVKTTLRVKDVDHFIKKLEAFKKVFPEYRDKKIYGAMAYLKANESAAKYAMKKKLFVIRATGSSASIINPENFRPAAF